MGNILISLDENKEALLRHLAKELHMGKKGSISAVVASALEELASKKKRQRAIRHQIQLMEKGFDLGLKERKAFMTRNEIYD